MLRRNGTLYLTSLLFVFWSLLSPTTAQLLTTHAGGTTAPAVTYLGPGDVVSGAITWWGLRGYNQAAATANLKPPPPSSGNFIDDHGITSWTDDLGH